MRVDRLPVLSKAIVYFDPSSGVSTAPSPPWNLTSCHDVPASGDPADRGCWELAVGVVDAKTTSRTREVRLSAGRLFRSAIATASALKKCVKNSLTHRTKVGET
jgi:hypothetical protein